MKIDVKNTALCIHPLPQTIVSCRDAQGNNNALAVGFIANVSLDPAMVMVGIMPSRYSHHMIKETGCFVVNFPRKGFAREYGYLGSVSGRDEDKFAALGLAWEEATRVNAPVLTGCPVSIECRVVGSMTPGTHELFVGQVEAVHADEEFVDEGGAIRWDALDLL